MDEEIKITITVKKAGTGYTSRHEIVGVDEATAAYILIDVGRNIFMVLATHHHGHGGSTYGPPASEHGHAVTTKEVITNGQ